MEEEEEGVFPSPRPPLPRPEARSSTNLPPPPPPAVAHLLRPFSPTLPLPLVLGAGLRNNSSSRWSRPSLPHPSPPPPPPPPAPPPPRSYRAGRLLPLAIVSLCYDQYTHIVHGLMVCFICAVSGIAESALPATASWYVLCTVGQTLTPCVYMYIHDIVQCTCVVCAL